MFADNASCKWPMATYCKGAVLLWSKTASQADSPRDGWYCSEQHDPLFLFLCLSANLKYSMSSSCATWTKATCQGLSTCLATSAPCESWGVSCSEAMAETLLTSPLPSLLFLSLSLRLTFCPAMAYSHLRSSEAKVAAKKLSAIHIIYLPACWQLGKQGNANKCF